MKKMKMMMTTMIMITTMRTLTMQNIKLLVCVCVVFVGAGGGGMAKENCFLRRLWTGHEGKRERVHVHAGRAQRWDGGEEIVSVVDK